MRFPFFRSHSPRVQLASPRTNFLSVETITAPRLVRVSPPGLSTIDFPNVASIAVWGAQKRQVPPQSFSANTIFFYGANADITLGNGTVKHFTGIDFLQVFGGQSTVMGGDEAATSPPSVRLYENNVVWAISGGVLGLFVGYLIGGRRS